MSDSRPALRGSICRHRSAHLAAGGRRRIQWAALLLALLAVLVPAAFADQPYAPSRDYDLMHARIELRFNVDQRQGDGPGDPYAFCAARRHLATEF